ncbi:DUF3892 domain-containing protein [Nannocystis sp. SCPEA4]|uniref:DUF3892 domain-containing protein n=1 Tax=Nannocystis sp. SCPEA4 TaxID=2996787 RepID=UPI002270E7C7|nr:DUF3892 domain-containing protein [Nannocystis sp. SCPEA4]MCY1059693.1 DUF3892 domain-containing protein [Nannocystis sp. SCPEA4]
MMIYYITHATKDSSGTIVRLKASEVSPSASGLVMSKADMIRLLDPARRNTAKTYKDGRTADVRVIDGRYLRSDANDTKADNLGDLPPV